MIIIPDVECPKDHPAYALWRDCTEPEVWADRFMQAGQTGDLVAWFTYAMDTASEQGCEDCR